MYVDHINGNGLDNRKKNLRICTNAENIRNSKMRKSNKSGVKGIYWLARANCWHATIKFNYKSRHVGYFKDIEQAKKAIMDARVKYHGEFANHD
jgi:hypothetical protein